MLMRQLMRWTGKIATSVEVEEREPSTGVSSTARFETAAPAHLHPMNRQWALRSATHDHTPRAAPHADTHASTSPS